MDKEKSSPADRNTDGTLFETSGAKFNGMISGHGRFYTNKDGTNPYLRLTFDDVRKLIAVPPSVEKDRAQKKPRKIPHYTNGELRSKTDAPEDIGSMASFDDAMAALIFAAVMWASVIGMSGGMSPDSESIVIAEVNDGR